jgi:hypothetical protein
MTFGKEITLVKKNNQKNDAPFMPHTFSQNGHPF